MPMVMVNQPKCSWEARTWMLTGNVGGQVSAVFRTSLMMTRTRSTRRVRTRRVKETTARITTPTLVEFSRTNLNAELSPVSMTPLCSNNSPILSSSFSLPASYNIPFPQIFPTIDYFSSVRTQFVISRLLLIRVLSFLKLFVRIVAQCGRPR